MSRLLIVDDSLSVRKAIERILATQGYEARSAASLTAARQALLVERPDLVLCDLILPDGDGLEILEDLEGTGVPVLCISAVVDAGVRQRVQAAGAAGLLPKPFSAGEILTAVATQLGVAATAPAAAPVQHPELQRSLSAAREWPGLVFAAVFAPEGGMLAETRGTERSAAVGEGRVAELAQLAQRMASELRSGMVESMVLEAPDVRLLAELLPEGEVLVLCVERQVLLGMALLYTRRIRRPASPLSSRSRSFGGNL